MYFGIIIDQSYSFKAWYKLLKAKIFAIGWCFLENNNKLIFLYDFSNSSINGGDGETEILKEDKESIHGHMIFLIF